MKGSLVFIMFFGVTLILLSQAKANECQSDSDCSFHGKCLKNNNNNNKSCQCVGNCRSDAAGPVFLCGEDENYYVNYCFLAMQSCDIQVNISVHWVGASDLCSKHPMHSVLKSQYDSGLLYSYKPCPSNENHCLNFGTCVIDAENERSCLCGTNFSGERCENRQRSPILSYIMGGRPISLVGSKSKKSRRNDVIILLVLCALSAMFWSIVTSAICYRIKQRSLKRFRKELLADPGRSKKMESLSDSRTDLFVA